MTPHTRIASYNVENLFARAKVMNLKDWKKGAPYLAAHARLNDLIQQEEYDDSTKKEMLTHLEQLGLLKSDEGTYARLRKIRGRFVVRPRKAGTSPYIGASGRDSWIGWVDLKTEQVTGLAMTHTAKVMSEVNAHVLGVVEAESRPLLAMFSSAMLEEVGGTPYDQVMLIDGNDDRGIDVGLLTRDDHSITEIRTHLYDADKAGVIFSRDCAEYHIRVRGTHHLVVLVNHFKSKGYGSKNDPIGARRRFRQAARLAAIYQDLRDRDLAHVAVLGDFNDTITSDALKPLVERTDLRDVSEHPNFEWNGRKGTFKSGNEDDKIDYVLLSPELFALTTGGAVFRKGVYRGNRTKDPWDIFDTMTKPQHEASDHAAIYADIDWPN